MDSRQRWFGKNRRINEERRKSGSADYAGPERRICPERRVHARSTLLLIDNSPTFLFYMGMLLKKLDYDVRTATTAEDALKMMGDFIPVLVITETTLPRMNAVSLIKQMRQDPRLKHIPVIFHTADVDPATRTSCKIEGCAGFFKKPVEPEPLYRAIQAATETSPRQTIRINTILPVEVRASTALAHERRKELITTLSEGGCYIKTLVPEPVNSVVLITLLMQGRAISTSASVLTSSVLAGGERNETGMAVKFLDISHEDKALVRIYIKEHLMQGLAIPLKEHH